MSEWWTYHLSDFLLFSPRTYFRLFEIYNAAIWPAQIVAVALGFVVLLLLALRGSETTRRRVIPAILAACWIWVAVAFLAHRYATINWAAVYFAWAWALEAVLLVGIGVVRRGLAFERPFRRLGGIGLALFLFALAAEPFLAPVGGRSFRAAEFFGVTPDPTAIATLGLLLLASGRRRALLMVISVLWCAITGATLLAMKPPGWWIPPAAAVIAIAVMLLQRRIERPEERIPSRSRAADA